MTNEDKKIVADYMVWKYWPSGKGQCYRVSENGGDVIIHFDLNDAGLVVQEMQKRGEWQDFMSFVYGVCHFHKRSSVTLYLFNADNFFKAFIEWRGSKR
jgi:hypothetical protein